MAGPDRDEARRLGALGLSRRWAELATERPDVRDACIRAARRVARTPEGHPRRVIGLLPASDEIGVSAIGVQLGLALAEVTGGTVAYVDANLRWPAISELALLDADGTPDEGPFALRWLRGSLALLVPPRAGQAGAGVPELARIIQHGAELFAVMLLDLTGYKRLGEHLAAIEMTDGVMIIGRAGLTTEDQLLRLNHELPPARNLGVLLIGR